jgi:hypothetical protein
MADRVAGELERLHQTSAFQDDDDLVFSHPRPDMCLTPLSCGAGCSKRSRAPAFARSHFTSYATPSGPSWPRRGRHCGQSRNGWVTPTPRQPRSTATTRRTRPAARPLIELAFATGPNLGPNLSETLGTPQHQKPPSKSGI